MPDGSSDHGEQNGVIGAEGLGTEVKGTGVKSDSFRDKGGEVIDNFFEAMDETKLEKELMEVKEWREGDFKDSMQAILEAQQEICGADGNEENCAVGKEAFDAMFAKSEKQEETAPAN